MTRARGPTGTTRPARPVPEGTETLPGLYPGGEAETMREHIEALEQMPLGFEGRAADGGAACTTAVSSPV